MTSYKNITVSDLQTLLAKGNVRLLDVRTEAETARGMIPKGEKLPLHLLPIQMSGMSKNAAIVFYCQVGGRSAQAAAFAASNGFTDVYNLQGGILAWAQAGLPLAE